MSTTSSLEPEFITDILDLLADPGNIECNNKIFVNLSRESFKFELPKVMDYSIGRRHFLEAKSTESEVYIVSVADRSQSETIILSVPESSNINCTLTKKATFKLTPLLPVILTAPGETFLNSTYNLMKTDGFARSLVKRQSCIAKKVASSKRERVGGKFKRCMTKWVSATDFFHETSSSVPSQDKGDDMVVP